MSLTLWFVVPVMKWYDLYENVPADDYKPHSQIKGMAINTTISSVYCIHLRHKKATSFTAKLFA